MHALRVSHWGFLGFSGVYHLLLQSYLARPCLRTCDGLRFYAGHPFYLLQSFPLVRRSVLAALSGCALLLGAAEAAERSANGTISSSWRQRAWGPDVDAKVELLLGEVRVTTNVHTHVDRVRRATHG